MNASMGLCIQNYKKKNYGTTTLNHDSKQSKNQRENLWFDMALKNQISKRLGESVGYFSSPYAEVTINKRKEMKKKKKRKRFTSYFCVIWLMQRAFVRMHTNTYILGGLLPDRQTLRGDSRYKDEYY